MSRKAPTSTYRWVDGALARAAVRRTSDAPPWPDLDDTAPTNVRDWIGWLARVWMTPWGVRDGRTCQPGPGRSG